MSSREDVWPQERIDRLIELWPTGLSASRIGERLGVSKSAVVGKAHRLDLPGRESPIRRELTEEQKAERAERKLRQESWARRHRKPKPQLALALDPPPPPKPKRSDVKECCWVMNPDRSAGRMPMYCNDATYNGSSYCKHHHGVCVIPRKQRDPLEQRTHLYAGD